ncbi:hypothetical protein [Enterococcus innesii]|uniref:hypothetical protein n=1 Tax=Enterococcus innesii TaxID=2839759 RepID=UPI0034A2BE4F
MDKANFGTEKQGKVIAVVDYTRKEKQFSKVLTLEEQKEFDETGNLPEGVTVKEVYPVVETFSTKQEAEAFIARGGKRKPDHGFGVFKSKAQYRLAKKLVAGNAV